MQTNYVTSTSNKSKGTALILCLLGGIMGLHRFYVGKIGSGFLYFITGGLMGIGWLYDLIAIAVGSFEDVSGAALRR